MKASWSGVAIVAVVIVSVACGGKPAATRSGGSDQLGCASVDDCAHHERECRLDARPACETCAGLVAGCTARSADEIAMLDRAKQKCEARPHGEFSYASGCRCVASASDDCPTPQAWCEAGGGMFSAELGCLESDLSSLEGH